MCERVTITTATADEAPMGTVLQFARSGELESCSKKVARQVRRGSHQTRLLIPYVARYYCSCRKAIRAIASAQTRTRAHDQTRLCTRLAALTSLCSRPKRRWHLVKLGTRHPGNQIDREQPDGQGVSTRCLCVHSINETRPRQNQVQSAPLAQPDTTVDPMHRLRANISQVWGPKTLEHLVPLDLEFSVPPEKSVLKRIAKKSDAAR